MSTNKRTIKSYNNYAAVLAERMRSAKNLSHDFLEKPAMYKKLPNLKGKNVLCIGCGSGEECEYIKSIGAKKVVGIDISKNLIDLAKKSYSELEFHVMDMEKINFSENSFDFVYSSLAMHYLKDWKKVLKGISRVLKRKGLFLFSTHHPIRYGSKRIRSQKVDSCLMGYEKYKTGRYLVFGDYLNARETNDLWFNEFTVTYYHRPISDVIGDILRSNFTIVDFIEPKPLKKIQKKETAFYDICSKIPLFIIFELKNK